MGDSLDIAEVVRLTGLTSRALRFYEARGLLAPLRTASGRRHYGARELERLHQITTLKRAGLSLAAIQRLQQRGATDLAALIDGQLEVLRAQAREVERAISLLDKVKSRVERSEPIDVATFCSLIQQGESLVNQERNWEQVSSRYFDEAQKAEFQEAMRGIPPEFDQSDYAAKWKDLGGRIKAALPLDPASERAQGFVREWNALLAPFLAVATPAIKEGTQRMYADMGNWEGQVDPGFDKQVFDFIMQAQRVSKK